MNSSATPIPIRIYRLCRLALHLVWGCTVAALVLPHWQPKSRENYIRDWCAGFLRILNVHPRLCGTPPKAPPVRTLLVANHISWLDIWALKQCWPVHLVAKSEIRGWPLIGWLAHQVGTLFIHRERRHDTARVASEIEQALLRDECLCFFPEGTTTDGTELKPFKGGLLQAAINTASTVQPVALRYPNADGSINTDAAYHGEMSLWQSLWAVLSQREIRVELHFTAPLAAAGAERRHLSHQARQAIASVLHPVRHTAPGTAGGLPGALH